MQTLLLLISLFTSSYHCEKVNFIAVYLRLTPTYDFILLDSYAFSSSKHYSFSIDSEIFTYVLPHNLILTDINKILTDSVYEVYKTSDDQMNFDFLSSKFCNESNIITNYNVGDSTNNNLNFRPLIEFKGRICFVELYLTNVQALKIIIENNALNRFYLNYNRPLNTKTPFLNLFLITKMEDINF